MVNADSLPTAYQRCFPDSKPVVIAAAPGRVNLIGEHVDYNNGLVLPCAIDRATYVTAGNAEGGGIHARSSLDDRTVSFRLDEIDVTGVSDWSVYVMGVAAELRKAGVRLTGANLYIESDVPAGCGLSSSAALEVAVAGALLELAGEAMGDADLAHLCRRAEHTYAGVPCGILDQYAVIMCRAGSALLLDCRNETIEHVPWADPRMALVIVDSAFPRRLAEGGYSDRRKQCDESLTLLRAADPRIDSLRDVTPETLHRHQGGLGRLLVRRTRHVITEIERTALAAAALRAGDYATLGRLMDESHESLRRDFEVSTRPLDDLVRIVRQVEGVEGARMTGGGFGGCIVAVSHQDAVQEIEIAVRNRYDKTHSVRAPFIPVRPGKGAWTTQLQR